MRTASPPSWSGPVPEGYQVHVTIIDRRTQRVSYHPDRIPARQLGRARLWCPVRLAWIPWEDASRPMAEYPALAVPLRREIPA